MEEGEGGRTRVVNREGKNASIIVITWETEGR
jgi:hypothetical protein